jgi:hypothetical protein
MFEGHQTHRRRQTGEGSRRCSRPEAVVGWTSLGGSLFSDWTYPFTGEPIPRLSSTSLGGSLFSEWTPPVTGEPVPRSSTSLPRAATTSCSAPGFCGRAGQVPRGKILHRHEHACSTSTSRHHTSRHAASCWPRCKSRQLHEHARRTGTHAT